MVGVHCNVLVGAVIESTQFYLPFELTWIVHIVRWLPGATQCLRGALI